MPNKLDDLRRRYGDALVQKATRVVLPGKDPLKYKEFDADELKRVDDYLWVLDQVGKPLKPGKPVPGATPIIGSRITPQGNPIPGNPLDLDHELQSGWHFAQNNGWDAWFNIVPDFNGGYDIYRPVCRPTGEHGPGTWGKETTGTWTAAGLGFTVEWNNGTSGRYEAGYSIHEKKLRGFTHDAGHPEPRYEFVGTKMPLDADLRRPGGPKPGPAPTRPLISPQAVQNQSQNGWNVTIGGSGFQSDEAWRVDGRYIDEDTQGEWGTYDDGTVDNYGAFTTITFGVIMPPGSRYEFRGIGDRSGQAPVVGIS